MVSELQFLEVIGKPLRGNSVMFDDSFLGVTPEALQAVDIDPASGEILSVIDPQVSITAEHERIVALETVGINDASPAYLLDGKREDRFGTNVGNHLHEDASFPLQNPEYRDFAGRATTSLPFSLSTEIGLVHLHFAADDDPFSILGVNQDRGTNRVDRFVDRIIGESQLRSDLPCGEFQFEQFDQAQPLSGGKISLVDPPSGEIVEGVAACGTATSFILQPVEFFGPATRAKPTTVFEAKSRQIFSGGRFGFY
mgnify:CR=1 FL=1